MTRFLRLAWLFLLPAAVYAQTGSSGNSFPSGSSGNTPPTGSSGNSVFVLHNPLNTGTFCGLIKNILNAILTIGIPVAVLFLVWAGFLFIWARGNAEGLAMARKNLFYVVIGIGLFLGAWSLGQIIAATLNNVQQGSGNPAIGACQ